ncbi:MAG TPA: AEC family transporter [Leucothrix mucor]|nr:AEC family transporter [Leucothrix mucor]
MSQLFNILFPVFILIFIGYLYARWRQADMVVVNRINLEVFIPALLIDVLAQKNFDIYSYRWIALACLLATLLSGVIAWLIGRGLKLTPTMFIPSMMFNNSANMGLPLAVLAFGEPALGAAVILFLVSTLLHSTIGLLIVGGRVSWWKLLIMPFNLAIIIGLTISFMQWQIPAVIHQPISMLGQIAIPLMLVSLGVRMVDADLSLWRIGLLGALARPFIGVIAAIVALFFIPLDAIQKAQFLLFSALPPAVLNYMFAEKYSQQPTEVASMVILGNALSIVTLSLMLFYLKSMGQL